jgi:peptidyl-prolyl cis-trans isomerase C
VTIELLLQETKQRNVVVSEAEAKAASDQKLKELRAQVPDQAAFNKAMAERNMTVAKLRSDIRNDILISRLLEAEMAKVAPPTDAELKDYYDKNPNEFSGVRAAHVLIRPEGFDEASKKKARDKAEDVMKQAKAGTDFGELAKQHSSDGSAQQGGDLGFFTKDRMVPPFANAAFALQPGQISDVVETQFGFHVIKVIERKDVKFEEATERLRTFLTARKREEAQAAFIKSLKDKAKIEVLV